MRDFHINAFGAPTDSAEEKKERRQAERIENGEQTVVDQRTVTLRVLAAAATVLFVVLAIGLIVNFVNLGRLNARKAALAEQLQSVNGQIAEGEYLIDERTSETYVERYAREQLGMVKDGEQQYYFD